MTEAGTHRKMAGYRPKEEGNLNRRYRIPRCARWALTAALMTVAGKALAQEQERLLPIQLGRVNFLPSVTVSHGWDSNVERLSDGDPFVGPIASGIGDIQPLLRFDLPYRKSLLRLVYRGDYRTYSADILKNSGGMSNFLDFTGLFKAGQQLQINVAASYVDSITSLLTVAPGGEYQYGTQPLTAKEARAGFAYQIGVSQSVEAGALKAETQFEPSATSALFTDYAVESLFFRYVLDSGPQNQIYLSLDRQNVQQNGVDTLLQPEDYRVRSVGVGFRRVTGRDLSSEVRVAYTSSDFAEGLWTPFQGITAEGEINLAPSPQTQLQLRLRRAPLVSFFNVSAYYLNEAVEFNLNRALGRRLLLRFLVGVQRNTFSEPIQVVLRTSGGELDQDNDGLIDAYENLLPSQGDMREDRLMNASLTAVWHVSRAMDFSVGYRHQQARSNVEAVGIDSNYHIYDYESKGFFLSAILGWQ